MLKKLLFLLSLTLLITACDNTRTAIYTVDTPSWATGYIDANTVEIQTRSPSFSVEYPEYITLKNWEVARLNIHHQTVISSIEGIDIYQNGIELDPSDPTQAILAQGEYILVTTTENAHITLIPRDESTWIDMETIRPVN